MRKHRFGPIFLLLCGGIAVPAAGDTLTWDDSAANNTWDTVETDIWGGAGPWTNANPDDAIFGGTGEAVTLGEAITAGSLTFNAAGYSLTGNTLTMAGADPSIIANSDVSISSILGGNGGLTKGGTGILSLSTQNTYTGGTNVTAGILDLTGGGGATGAIRGSLTVGSGATVRFSTGDATGWSASSPRVDVMNINGGTVHVNTTSNQTFANMAIIMTGGTISGVSGSNFDFFSGSSSLTTLGSADTATVSMNARLRQANTTFDIADGAAAVDLLWSGQLNQSGGTNNFIKTGDGHMDLTGAGTWSGTTTLNGGSLRIANQLRNTASITANTGTTLELGATNIFTSGHGAAMADSRVITVNDGTLLMNGSFDSRFGNVTLNDGATWTSNRALANWDALLANTDAGAATVTVGGSGAATMNGSGGIHLQGVQNFDVADTTGDDGVDLSVSMRLANQGRANGAAGGILKTGAGTMLLNNNSNYFNGDLTVNEGRVVTGTAQGGGTNGHLGLVSGSRTITVNSGAVLDFRANNQFGGGGKTAADLPAIVVDGGTLTSTRFNILGDVTLNNGATLTQSTTDGGSYDGYEFLGSVTVGGSSASTISTGNGSANHLGAGVATFDVADVTGDSATDLTVSAPLRDASGDYGFGAGGISKTGTGTMTLEAANTYSGATNVTEGTLALAGSGSINNSSGINVGSSATIDVSAVGGLALTSGQSLTGNGTVIGTITVAGGSTLAPGESIGTLSFDDGLVLAGISEFEIDASNGTADMADIAGVFELGGVLNVTNLAGILVEGQAFDLFDFNNGISIGSFDSWTLPILDGGLAWDVSALNSDGIIEVIPEPSIILLALLGAFGILVRRRW